MKKSMKFATALAGAAVVVVGGTAFTNSNTDMQANAYAGTGSTTVSGVTIDDVTYNYADGTTNLETIVWTTKETIPNAAYTITSTLAGAAAPADTCVSGGQVNSSVITCTWTAPVSVQTVTGVSLTVVMKDAYEVDTTP